MTTSTSAPPNYFGLIHLLVINYFRIKSKKIVLFKKITSEYSVKKQVDIMDARTNVLARAFGHLGLTKLV